MEDQRHHPVPGDARKSRRRHKKSRHGCQYCKRRRIKCDEIKPVCSNCSRASVRCSYAPPGSQPGEAPDLGSRKRGRPRKNWTVVSVRRSATPPAEPTGPASTTPPSLTPASAESSGWYVEKSLHLPLDAEDLELFFHYLGEVCAGMGTDDTQLWRERVPRLAFRRHGVLHLILASSALHLARKEPFRARLLEERAEMHLTIGLRRATEILPCLSTENHAELYVSTILVCICSFAKQPGPRNLLVVAEGSEVAWMELFRGVRTIVETFGLSSVYSGELGASPADAQGGQQVVEVSRQHGDDQVSPGELSNHDPANINTGIGWEDALDRLSTLISSSTDEVARGACQSAVGMMTWCFQDIFGTSARPKAAADAKFSTVMAWTYCLSDEYISALRQKDPASLVLLAHYAVLLQTLESVWFMRGWAAHVLHGVSEILGPAWSEWLKWPTLQIKDTRALIPTEAPLSQ